MITLYLVIPCYNEEAVLPETCRRLALILDKLHRDNRISGESRLLLVDDGSADKTWEIICREHSERPFVEGLKLSHNCGHQNALLAGLMEAKDRCDCAVSMDSDMQDDPKAIFSFLEAYEKGADIVYGVRSSREKDSFFKRQTALWYYRLLKLLGADIVYNHADYRLMSRRALQALSQYDEVNLFLRGIVPTLGFSTAVVYYERHERYAGESKYTLGKMLSLALNGVTSFSVRPLRVIALLGFVIFAAGMVLSVYYALGTIFGWGERVRGWASLICTLWTLGGLQLLGIGVLGEYIGKIYMETKRRPLYIIEERLR